MSKTINWKQTQLVWQTMPHVIAAWAFGSAQGGIVSDDSDVDIGVLMDQSPSFEEQVDLLTRLQKAIQIEEVDLIILNNANPHLRFEAISGKLLFCRDPSRKAAFVSLTAREYEDEMAFWQRALLSR
jgi:predicted nucleotidyltransferase